MGRKPTHGKRYTKEYNAWSHMKDRCLNPKHKRYADYGGRGVTVCERWMKFENFLEDMGVAPSKKYTLERNDNDGIYEKSNCEWATNSKQQSNKRCIKRYTYRGLTCNLKWWAKALKIDENALRRRIKAGMTIEEVVANPPKKRKTASQSFHRSVILFDNGGNKS